MILLDSSVLIDVLRKEPKTMRRLAELAKDDDLGTTSINIAEVLRGQDDTTTARRILAGLTEIPFGPRAAVRFGRMMQDLDRVGRPVPVIDGLIAAATIEAGAFLATRDRTFARIPGLATLRA